MRSPLAAALAAVLVLGLVPALAAQSTSIRHGMWAGLGLGVGSARLSCGICQGNRDGGTSGYLRAGTTVSNRFLLGLEGTGWYRSDGGVDQFLGSLQAVVFFYPNPQSGFYLKGGLGISQYSAKDSQDELSSQALAGQVGVGFEVPVARAWSIVPFANFLGSTSGDVRFNDTVGGLSASSSLLQVGVGVTLH